jgi:hypothetical protein
LHSPHAYIAPREIRNRYSALYSSNNSFSSVLTRPTAPSPFTCQKITPPHFCCLAQTSGFSAPLLPPTWPGLFEHTTSMSRPTQPWDSNDRQGSDDDGYEYAGSSLHDWRTRQRWEPQHQSQLQQRNVAATSSCQGTGAERQQRRWHRGAVTTLRQSSARPLRQQQPLRSGCVTQASSPPASALPWRTRNELAKQQQNSPPRSRWHTRERDNRGGQSAQEPFAQQQPSAWPTRAWSNTHERTATGRVRQERVQSHRRPRDWDDTRLSPPATRNTDEQLPVGERFSHGANVVKQSRPWREAGARDTSVCCESEESDLQSDCHHENRSAAEFVQVKEPAEKINRQATFRGPGTFTPSTRPTVANKRIAARPWASKTKARRRTGKVSSRHPGHPTVLWWMRHLRR